MYCFIIMTITNRAGIYLFKVKNRKTRTMCEISSKSTIKTSGRRQSIFQVQLTAFSSRVFPLLTLNKWMPTGKVFVDFTDKKNYKNLEICVWYKSEVLAQRCYVKQVFWKISRNLQENTRVSPAFQSLFLKNLSCYRPETLSKIPSTQVFYCEFSKVFQNTYLEYLWMAASEKYLRSNQNQHFIK